MSYKNELKLEFLSLSENESFARLAVASFCTCKSLELEEVEDIKTAVSEAVTNAIVHGYIDKLGWVKIHASIDDEKIEIEVHDEGVGIDDINKAIQPFFTTKKDMERSGMGFTVMESFMDKMDVKSSPNQGTTVTLTKFLNK